MATLIGTNNADSLDGGAANDLLLGGNGNDTLNGNSGNDILDGGNGNDVLNAGSGNDILEGGNGNDTLNGGSGNDILDGSNGDDILNGGSGSDLVSGGNGNDRFTYNVAENNGSVDIYIGGNGSDTLTIEASSSFFARADVQHAIAAFNAATSGSTFFFANYVNGLNLVINTIEKIQFSIVNIAPVAGNDLSNGTEDVPQVISVNSLLANDVDGDGDPLSLQSFTQAGHGTISLNNGNFTYTPVANFNGQDAFTYTVSDGNGGTSQATVQLNIAAVNDNPVAGNDAVSAVEDTPLVIQPDTLLANDSDVDGNTLTIQTATNGTHGSVSVVNGNLVYTPDSNFNGQDSFAYTVSDGQGGITQASVAVNIATVNDNPVAGNDAVSAVEDTPLVIQPDTLLANDSDVDGNTLTIQTATNGTHGSVSVVNGNLVYTPDSNFNGQDSFAYTVSDGQGGVTQASVAVNIAAVNDNPVAGNDAVSAVEDTPLVIQPDTLLANDSDVDGNTLTIQSATNGTHGSVNIVNGNLVYTPDSNFNGQDSFAYTVSDGQGGVTQASVAIDIGAVNDPVTGNVTIDGVAKVNQTLTANTATLADADGLGTLNYQWQQNGVNINGATTSNYLVTQADLGKNISVNVSYIDGEGTAENAVSAATASVISNNEVSVTDPALIVLENNTITINGVLQDSTIQSINTGADTSDQVVVHQIIDGLSFDLGGVNSGGAITDPNNLPAAFDVVNLHDFTGATYKASDNSLTDTSGNSMTVTNSEAFVLGEGGNDFIIDKGGAYNFLIDNTFHNTSSTPHNEIKMVEGTGSTSVGLIFYGNSDPANLLPQAEIQKLDMEMQFNNTGPNVNNIATLDFNHGTYSFNATAIEYGLIAAQLAFLSNATFAQAFLGELKISLTDTTLDPIQNSVTAEITGLRDFTFPVQGGSDFQPWIIVENATHVRGIADFSSIIHSVDVNNPELPQLNVFWNGDLGTNHTGLAIVSETENIGGILQSISNSHALYNFQQLNLGLGNDTAAIANISITSGNQINMGDKADATDHDTLDLSILGSGINLGISYDQSNNGLLSFSGREMSVLGAEEIIGTNFNDTIAGDARDNTVTGGKGNDTMTGGNGHDTFVFSSASGHDLITDFNSNLDSLHLLNGTQIQSLQIVGNNTVLHFDANNDVTLVGVNTIGLGDIHIT